MSSSTSFDTLVFLFYLASFGCLMQAAVKLQFLVNTKTGFLPLDVAILCHSMTLSFYLVIQSRILCPYCLMTFRSWKSSFKKCPKQEKMARMASCTTALLVNKFSHGCPIILKRSSRFQIRDYSMVLCESFFRMLLGIFTCP